MIDESCLASTSTEMPIDDHSGAPSPQQSDEETVILETQVRSTKCPTGIRKRKATESCAPELQILHNMQEAMGKDGADDSLDLYGKVVVNKLRLITDPMDLFIVQNEIDQMLCRVRGIILRCASTMF